MVVINETFASVAHEGDYVVLWHEAIAGQKAFEVASSYIKCINTSTIRIEKSMSKFGPTTALRRTE